MPATKAGHSNDAFELPVITSPYIAHTLVHLLASCTAMDSLVGIFMWVAEELLEYFYIYVMQYSISVFIVCREVKKCNCNWEFASTPGIASLKSFLTGNVTCVELKGSCQALSCSANRESCRGSEFGPHSFLISTSFFSFISTR